MELNKNIISGRFIFPLIFIIIAINLILPKNYLLIRSYETGEVLFYSKIKDNFFKTTYTHSIEKTDVSQIYEINNGKIILKEERYKSLGAGLAANTPYNFKKDKDGFVIYNIDEIIEPLIYRTGRVANHRLYIDGKEYLFTDFSQPGEGVLFNIERHFPFVLGGIKWQIILQIIKKILILMLS